MKHTLIYLAAASLIGLCGCSHNNSSQGVNVYVEAENYAPDSINPNPHHRITLSVSGDLKNVKRLAFNKHEGWSNISMNSTTDTLIQLIPGYFAIASDRFAQAAPGDTLRFDIDGKNVLSYLCFLPDGIHTVEADGTTRAANVTYFDMSADPKNYTVPGRDAMPYGDFVYDRNAEIISDFTPAFYDVVPSFKAFNLTGGESNASVADIEFVELINPDNEDYYEAVIENDKITISANPKNWKQLQKRFEHHFGDRTVFPNAKIIDWPSFEHRGLHFDPVRNFQPASEVHKFLDMMAVYGLNKLHFHLTDDEGWRLQINALPELTEVGARRGYYADPNVPYIYQSYHGDGNPYSKNNSGNGFYTQEEFVEMLRHANELSIDIIPEIETPGHAFAAIKAMDWRAKNTGDDSYLLAESKNGEMSFSVQGVPNNVMNPALDGPYKFIDTVVGEIDSLFVLATGEHLKVLHIGGDEVAHNAWVGSEKMNLLVAQEGLDSDQKIHDYFVNKMARQLADRDIQVMCWQEVINGATDQDKENLRPNMAGVNWWYNSHRAHLGAEIAEGGFPIVLSCVDHLYFDMHYSHHPEERGLAWDRPTDEMTALNAYPSSLCPFPGANIKGLQAQLWAETYRGPNDIELATFPKITGLAERAWNSDSTYTEPQLHALVLQEMPRWENAGINFHLRQPGIKVSDNGKTFTVNCPYPDATVRYTTDGSRPSASAAIATPGESIAIPEGSTKIRATIYRNGKESVPTLTVL